MYDATWVKFRVNMHEDIKLKILDEMDNRDLHHYLWTRSVILAGKSNRGGYLYINDNIPYTIKTLAIEFNRSIDEVKASFKILIKLEMIEMTEGKVYKIKNWEKHQNVEGLDRLRQLNNERVAKHRAKKKELNEKTNEEDTDDIEASMEAIENKDANINNVSKTENEANENCKAIGNNIDNSANENSNVTCNANDYDSNITVMGQIKKEKKKEIEKKNESESESESEINNEDCNSVSNVHEITHVKTNSHNSTCGENKINLQSEKINALEKAESTENQKLEEQQAAKLLKHYENITGKLGGLNIGLLKLAVNMHGYKNVEMAMNKALQVNKGNMTYIDGILRNWRREGYPKDDVEVKANGTRGYGKNKTADKNEFAGFKPKKPRNLTEVERKNAEKDLI